MSTHWTRADMPPQTGRVAVVTGANSGLGQEIALALAVAGARVVLACRDRARAEAAAERIRNAAPPAELEVRALDLADLSSVRAFAEGFAADHDRLDLLVNNAGLMAVDEDRTTDGFEMQVGVNHLGHFALTARLLPLLIGVPGARIGTMSSVGHRAGRLDLSDLMFERRRYDRWRPYAQSKLANLLFTAELQRRLRESGSPAIAVAAHPGASATDLGFEGRGPGNLVVRTLMPWFAQPVVQGALPMLRAVTDPGVRGGEFYGPRWIGFGHPVPEPPSRAARDLDDAGRLWDLSADLTGLTPAFGR
jgi:NAD(P)-dependent dehydrogenase (short-subunit alcohol dehydrogenase family)